ncbi:NAD(P)-dependent oxidoreductase [Rhodococcus sp. IEGM 1354]|uniref:NAD(P)-dependent oxidoreductase n=1 Tax=Rhodococcus sp. IEGM 1354 TaxID=3047088 RepID=UPI0024B69197|nr:NAD(P)-dependent oxidoreductase [Rhodococcus sp. IEGM 1354]MDI9929687.1 NAD(P)-dependent oxidoreductase [Rhodococcus sp. IEGM 1354]
MTASVGVVGLGRMGLPMVAALKRAGFTVSSYDRSPEARAATAGSVDTLADVTGDIVILMLPNSAIVEAVLTDPEFTALRRGVVVVDMSSSEPSSTRALGERLAEAGIDYLDAPVSGGVARAESASLTIMAGGSSSTLERARPVLEAMGTITHVGDLGAGHAVKACNNVLVGVTLLAAVEVLEIVRSFGVDPAVAFDVINSSTGRSWSSEHKVPTFVLSEEYRSGFGFGLLTKDMGIAVGLADELGVEHALLDSATTMWRRAGEELPTDADHTSIAEWVAGQSRSLAGGAA